jgi:hypothetical protein
MAVRIEDAGFEIRDMIAWVYGSGFPKSMDISKQLDKIDASQEQEKRRLRFTQWVRSTGVTSRQIDEATGTNMGGHYTTAASQPAIMTREHLEACRGLLGSVPEWVEQEADIRSVESKNFEQRGFYETPTGGLHGGSGNTVGSFTGRQALPSGVTLEAKQWEGWGTALKPALEPITLARKPPIGTIAANVLEHGTGGLNIDGCRIEANGDKLGGGRISTTTDGWDRPWKHDSEAVEACKARGDEAVAKAEHAGRFPANLIHDGSDEVLALFPSEAGGGFGVRGKGGSTYANGEGFANTLSETGQAVGYGDSGSAARFFYCAKASRDDRDEGCGAFELKAAGGLSGRNDGTLGSITQSRNPHPTVKPTDLMRYLCRLITPPGGIVLDPFTGSGSTGKAAMAEGFRFIGIEREAEYIEIARARISAEAQKPRQLSLF